MWLWWEQSLHPALLAVPALAMPGVGGKAARALRALRTPELLEPPHSSENLGCGWALCQRRGSLAAQQGRGSGTLKPRHPSKQSCPLPQGHLVHFCVDTG